MARVDEWLCCKDTCTRPKFLASCKFGRNIEIHHTKDTVKLTRVDQHFRVYNGNS